jgi:3-oxoacyl-[acyl-carrier-protein] synthase II
MSAALVEGDMVCAYGRGVDRAWTGLLSRRAAFADVDRFNTRAHPCHRAALAPGLSAAGGESLVWQMLEPLLADLAPRVPADADILLATTTGEIDLLERQVNTGEGDAAASQPARLLERARARLGLTTGRAAVVSAACASSTVALALAADRVARDPAQVVVVVAADAVTEFVFAGFSALLALDPQGARPFDRNRKGLTLGDGAAVAVVMNEARAHREDRRPAARIVGWGISCDANHMTGPAPDGGGLARAIAGALAQSGADPADVASVSAHGTGTAYNDSMELKALRAAMPDARPPVYSVKGGLGHTLGAAGLVETLLAAESLRRSEAPPTVGLSEADPEAGARVSASPVPAPGPLTLTTNSGFGGVNAALLLARPGGAA